MKQASDAVPEERVRERLQNWGNWQKMLAAPKPANYPAPQPMFKEMVSGYNEEDDRDAKNKPAPDVDDAEFIEHLICRLNEHDRSALVRYFAWHGSTEVAAKKMGMSRRKFERWLNVAIGKITILIETYDEPGLPKSFRG